MLEFAAQLYRVYKNSGFDVFITSSESGEGVGDVRKYLENVTKEKSPICAFAGASGAGKSTLMNAIFPSLTLETGDLSQKIERGKNTTRHTELFPLSDLLGKEYSGYLADTPGFSLLDFERFDFFALDDLALAFPEIRALVGKCRYADCAHVGEGEDECAVARAAKKGEIPESRLASYRSVWRVLKAKKDYE